MKAEATSIGETLAGADAARLDQPNDFTIDDVLAALDTEPPAPRDLYYRWEHQQWEATQIDLTIDRASWSTAPDELRSSLRALLGCLFIPGERGQEVLVPLADSAPLEEQQVFLTTQMVDLARHTVFIGRFLTEVSGEPTDDISGPQPVDALTVPIAHRAGKIEDAGDRDPFHEVLFMQSILLEGVLAVAVERRVADWLEQGSTFDGLRLGLLATARDNCRHALFARRVLEEAIVADAEVAASLQAVLEHAVPLFPKVFDAAAADSMDLAGLPFGAHDLTTDAMDDLAKRIDDVGLDLPG